MALVPSHFPVVLSAARDLQQNDVTEIIRKYVTSRAGNILNVSDVSVYCDVPPSLTQDGVADNGITDVLPKVHHNGDESNNNNIATKQFIVVLPSEKEYDCFTKWLKNTEDNSVNLSPIHQQVFSHGSLVIHQTLTKAISSEVRDLEAYLELRSGAQACYDSHSLTVSGAAWQLKLAEHVLLQKYSDTLAETVRSKKENEICAGALPQEDVVPGQDNQSEKKPMKRLHSFQDRFQHFESLSKDDSPKPLPPKPQLKPKPKLFPRPAAASPRPAAASPRPAAASPRPAATAPPTGSITQTSNPSEIRRRFEMLTRYESAAEEKVEKLDYRERFRRDIASNIQATSRQAITSPPRPRELQQAQEDFDHDFDDSMEFLGCFETSGDHPKEDNQESSDDDENSSDEPETQDITNENFRQNDQQDSSQLDNIPVVINSDNINIYVDAGDTPSATKHADINTYEAHDDDQRTTDTDSSEGIAPETEDELLSDAESDEEPPLLKEEQAICPICKQVCQDPVKLRCGHSLCGGCMANYKASTNYKPQCPDCRAWYGSGTQPGSGSLSVTRRSDVHLDGYSGDGTIMLEFNFPAGVHGEHDPCPGRSYSAARHVAYLPDEYEGNSAQQLLQKAFDMRLVFKLGTNGIKFSDIPLKTGTTGGPDNHSYPDPGYLLALCQQLKQHGVDRTDGTVVFGDQYRAAILPCNT